MSQTLFRHTQIAAHPDFPWLTARDPGLVDRLMKSLGWLAQGECVTAVGPAGEGNIT